MNRYKLYVVCVVNDLKTTTILRVQYMRAIEIICKPLTLHVCYVQVIEVTCPLLTLQVLCVCFCHYVYVMYVCSALTLWGNWNCCHAYL